MNKVHLRKELYNFPKLNTAFRRAQERDTLNDLDMHAPSFDYDESKWRKNEGDLNDDKEA